MENDSCYFNKNGEKKTYSPDAINYARERVSYELSYTYGMGFTDEQRDWIADHIFVSVRKTYQDVLDKQVEKSKVYLLGRTDERERIPICKNPRSICVRCCKRHNCSESDTGAYVSICKDFVFNEEEINEKD